jgi:tetratricopeptide (TPR) repeat protein
MRALLTAVSILGLVACDARALQAPDPEGVMDKAVAGPLATGEMLFLQHDFPDAVQALEPIVAPQVLNTLSPERGHEVITLYANVAWWGGDYAKSHWAYVIATQSPQATADDWVGRLKSAPLAGDPGDAYAAFDHLRQSDPDEIRSMSQRALGSLSDNFAVLPNADEADLQLGQVLLPLDQTDPRAQFAPIWLRAAAVAVERGDKDLAAKFARRINQPQVMAELRADRRFDALVAADPAAFDVRAVGEAELARGRALAAAAPDHLGPRYQVAAALYRLGRYDEALSELDAALPNDPAWGEDPGYSMDLVARKITVLGDLGRSEEALAISSSLCALCGRKSHMDLQQAHVLLGLQRPAEALSLLAGTDTRGLNLVGLAELAALRACAYHGTGRDKEAAAQLDTLRLAPANSPDDYLGALLCVGRDDEVATAIVSLLNDPRTRDATLGDLQIYREDGLPPLTRRLRARLAVIEARADVRAAIAKVGRVETYQMPRWALLG